MRDKLPPHSPEAEQGVIGCAMLNIEAFDEAQASFKTGSEVFYDVRHKKIFDTIGILRSEGQEVDTITLTQRLKDRNELNSVGGIGYVSALPDKVPSASNIDHYTAIVLQKFWLRRLIKVCAQAEQKAFGDVDATSLIGEVENEISKLDFSSNEPFDGQRCAQEMVTDLERRFNLQGKRSGLTTGFGWLDHLTDGLQFGEQTVIAARPSMGKTAIAINIAERVCIIDGHPTLFCTFEMSPAALSKRMLSSHCKISMKSLRTGLFAQDEFQKFASFGQTLRNSSFHILDAISGTDCNRLAAGIRRMVRKHGIKLVIIDYLQKIRPASKHEKRTYEVGQVSETLKSLAVETKAAFLTLAQLNREPERDKGRKPRLSDLADSGQIEKDADCVALLHRDRAPGATAAELFVAKQRDGEIGIVNLTFNGEYCRFENPQPQPSPQTE